MSPDDEHYIGYTMTDVARLLRTVFERRVRAAGLTRAQWVIIARLHRRPGLSQSEVADLLEIEKATAGRLIDRMEEEYADDFLEQLLLVLGHGRSVIGGLDHLLFRTVLDRCERVGSILWRGGRHVVESLEIFGYITGYR